MFYTRLLIKSSTEMGTGMKNRIFLFKKAAFLVCIVFLVPRMLAACGSQTDENLNIDSTAAQETEKNAGDNKGEKTGAAFTIDGKSIAQPYEKEETVYAKAEPDGGINEVSVEIMLRNPSENDSDLLSDVSDLSEIINQKGDEEFVQEGGQLFWENHGEDISYKGKSGGELPVDVRITYYLDGQEIEPDKLAGQSGEIRIRFDYENKETRIVNVNDRDVTVHVPFAVMSVVVMPSDNFSDIEVDGGEVITMDDTNIVVGMTYPGIEADLKIDDYDLTEDLEIQDYVEITADAEDFELKFTATIISTGTFEDMDPDELDDIEEMPGDMDELKDASGEIVDGTGELYDAAEEFKGYMNDYMEYIVMLKEGIASIQQGLGYINDNKQALQDGASGLQNGLEQLNQGILVQAAAVLGITEPEQINPENILNILSENEALLREKINANTATEEEIALYAQIQTYIQLLTSTSQLAEGSKQLTEGITTLGEGVDKLYEGAVSLHDAAREIVKAGNELNDGFGEMRDGIKELADGVKEFDEDGIQEVAKLADDRLLEFTGRVRALKEADSSYTNFSGLSEETKGSVRFIIETGEIKK